MRTPVLACFAVIILAALFVTADHVSSSTIASEEDTGTVSGVVFHDLNGDGIRNPREPGLAGWHVTLEGQSDEPLPEKTSTDERGEYAYSGLTPGDYDVILPCEGQPSLWGATENEYNAISITLDDGEQMEVDFPVILIDAPPRRTRDASISGRLVWDENRHGVADLDEPGVSSWRVTMRWEEPYSVCFPQDSPVTASGADGEFSFSGLIAGTYRITLDDGILPVAERDWVVDTPGTTRLEGGFEWFDPLPPVELSSREQEYVTVGILSVRGAASISGGIYRDQNQNGVRDAEDVLAGESCLIGLFYRTPNGYTPPHAILSPAETGTYAFSLLASGDYLVSAYCDFRQPTKPPAGMYGIPWFPLTLGDGEKRTGVDFGFVPEASSTPDAPTSATPVPTQSTPTSEPIRPSSPGWAVEVRAPVTGDGGRPSSAAPYWLIIAAVGAGVAITVAGGVIRYRASVSEGGFR